MTGIDSLVIRIPVAGPDPFNTLVVVREPFNGTGAGTLTVNRTGSPGTIRSDVTFKTSFVLIGFDPRIESPYVHSTTVVLQALQLSDDTTFTLAVDSVRAGFDDEGRWTVIANTTVSMDDPGFEILSPGVTSWVLCYEPPPPPQRGMRKAATLAEAFKGARSLIR